MAKLTAPLAFLAFAAMISTLQAQVNNKVCDYEMVVSTGPSRGPSSMKLWVILEAIGGDTIKSTNVVKRWGAMGPKYTYFLPNTLDKFRAKLPCVENNFCAVLIGGKKGELKPHWYINNITVATKGEGINRFKTFGFFSEKEFDTVNPYITDGECP